MIMPTDGAIPSREGADSAALYRLLAWLSPAYPVGGFSYSSGIEWAVESKDVIDRATLEDWLAAVIETGAIFCDAVFFVHAHRATAQHDWPLLHRACEWSAAFCASAERFLETTAQGRAFAHATSEVWPCAALEKLASLWDGPLAYPVAVAVAAAGHGITEKPALEAFIQALTATAISAGVRLIPLGQTDGLRIIAALEGAIAATAKRAATVALDDLGAASFRADLAALHHETQYTRLFRS